MDVEKRFVEVLGVPAAGRLIEVIKTRSTHPKLDALGDPERAMRFMQSNLCGSYVFARLVVPAYAGHVFASLSDWHPADNAVGLVLQEITEVVRGELFNNNIFGRAGECHSHFHDAYEAFEAAADAELLAQWKLFADLAEDHALFSLISRSGFWSQSARLFARNAITVSKNPLTVFILMTANEMLTPKLYARAAASLCRESRFDKFRQFLETHVDLDGDDHGPVTLDWLEMYLSRDREALKSVEWATECVVKIFSGSVVIIDVPEI